MKVFLLPLGSLLFLVCQLASADCSSSLTLPNVPLFFYSNPLGIYTINLTPTMTAIESGDDESGQPYYEKSWRGDCPGGLSGSGNSCVEFTVYPDATNFTPGNIMQKIEQYTSGRPNRGEVRIITNSDQTQYVYTTDHESTFCGPYAVPQS